MRKETIIKQIDDRVQSAKTKKYSLWYCGITADPDTRKEQHENAGENVKHWKHWQADSEQDARDIEDHFHKKGMKGEGGGGKNPTWVYIF